MIHTALILNESPKNPVICFFTSIVFLIHVSSTFIKLSILSGTIVIVLNIDVLFFILLII